MRGLLVGRFQPFHLGHLYVLRWAREHHPNDQLLLGIGSAQESHTWENPFTAGERWEMIDRAITEAGVESWAAAPIADIQRHSQWVAYVASLLPRFERVYANNPLTQMLFEEAGYAVETPPLQKRNRWQGSVIRAAIAAGRSWKSSVPLSVQRFLANIDGEQRVRLLAPATRPARRG